MMTITRTKTCGVANPGGVPCTKLRGHAAGHDSASYGPTQPAPDGGEWRLSSAEVNEIMTKRLTGQTAVPLTCIDLPKHHGAIVVLDGPETAAQIVADHHAVPRLVEAASAALEALRYLRDVDPQHWDYHVTPEVCTAWDKLRAVLAATTTPPDAGEGRV